ncbi:MAG: hypothetical protein CMJ34_01130 [Phycisphaerae bacterium]|nr:hypothetical protein [Phycisphaerae bacterium]
MKPLLPALALAGLLGPATLAQTVSPTMSKDLESIQASIIEEGLSGSNVLLVVRDGEVVHEHVENSGREGDRDIQPDTLFPIWSMSKPITIAAMLTLHEQGLFDWKDPVAKYLPCFAELTVRDGDTIRPARTPLRIIDLMTHRAGWSYYNLGEGPPPTVDQPQPDQTRFRDLQEFCETAAAYPLESDPGSAYVYGINQAILGRLVEVLSGKPFAEYLEETILEPLGMEQTSFVLDEERRTRFQPLYINRGTLRGYTEILDELNYSPESRAHFGGEGLVSTLDDYARFAEMLLNRGMFRGRRILSEASIDRMTEVTSEDIAGATWPGLDMGFSVFVISDDDADGHGTPAGTFGWFGYHSTQFWIDPANDLYAIYLSRTRDFHWPLPGMIRDAVYD